MTDKKPFRGLVIGVANENSIAWGCAKALREAGADIAMTYLNEKTKTFIEPLAKQIDAEFLLPLDVTNDDQTQNLFDEISTKWDTFDFLLHSIAFAPKEELMGRVTDSSREGFMKAMDVSCHSLVRLTKLAEPFMEANGGSILTMSYYGGRKVIDNYSIMGPVKAALEMTVRYLAAELGPKNIRVNALSPGPIKTRAASGLSHFDDLMEKAALEAPIHHLLSIEQVGEAAAFMLSGKARHITGQTIHIDNGYNIVG